MRAPASVHRALKKPFFGRFQGEWRWPRGVERDEWEDVRIRSESGVDLRAVYAPAKGATRCAVVMAHPMGRTAKGFWLKGGHGELLRDAGAHVLVFDFNGFGESPSGTFDYPADVLAVGRYMAERHGDLPIGIVGASFGGAWAICAMARSHPFRAALIESTFPTLADFWKDYPLPHATLRLLSAVAPRLERRLRPVEQAKHLQGQPTVELLYSNTDPHTPVAYGERLLLPLQQSTSASLRTVERAGHTFILRDDPDRYAEAVERMLEATREPHG